VPLITPLALLANAAWWTVLPGGNFAWATIFHGVQYLAITLVFHARENPARPLASTAAFYATCLAGSSVLFHAFPRGMEALGFASVGSVVVVTAMVNVHHFIVDAYIWRLRGDANAKVVAAA
jgi:hypothetical protein